MTAELTIDESMRARIYGWAYRLLQNHHDALDATQEVLIRSLTRRSGGVENRQAWLRRITINYCLDVMRQRRPAGTRHEEPVEATTPASEAGARELHRAVLAGLNLLTGQQRAVLVAKVYDSETFAAIAHSMGLSVSSVKTHYVRALSALRRPLKGHTENES